MPIRLFNALAGAGKTYSLARHAHKLAEGGKKVLFIQPTKLLISKTIEDEIDGLDPSYPIHPIHGGETSSVVRTLVQHFKDATPDEGEIVFATHSAFFRLPYFHRRGDWTLIVDEVPSVDVFEEFRLVDTHDIITPFITLKPEGAVYGRLLEKDDVQ
jgi:superfamily II DNA or RNA helicase